MKKITHGLIAKEVGVSRSTVSYVLNGRTEKKISQEVKDKILKIAKDRNYYPNHFAVSLTKGKTNLIGILTWK